MKNGHDYVIVGATRAAQCSLCRDDVGAFQTMESRPKQHGVRGDPFQERNDGKESQLLHRDPALSELIVLAWQFLYMNPRIEAQRRAEEALKGTAGPKPDLISR